MPDIEDFAETWNLNLYSKKKKKKNVSFERNSKKSLMFKFKRQLYQCLWNIIV